MVVVVSTEVVTEEDDFRTVNNFSAIIKLKGTIKVFGTHFSETTS